MLRSFSLSVMVILLLSSGVYATIGQTEGFSISALNKVQRVGGAGWAESGNVVMIGHGQRAYAAGTTAIQKETGFLAQGARTAGLGGSTKISQSASVYGQQGQMIAGGRHGIQTQGQSLTVSLDNVVRKAGGIGGATGAQGFVGGQNQIMITPNGIAANYQVVGAAQYAAVSGCPGSNVVISNTLDVEMDQNQIITGVYAHPKPRPPCDP